jgi:hypothetical protein
MMSLKSTPSAPRAERHDSRPYALQLNPLSSPSPEMRRAADSPPGGVVITWGMW